MIVKIAILDSKYPYELQWLYRSNYILGYKSPKFIPKTIDNILEEFDEYLETEFQRVLTFVPKKIISEFSLNSQFIVKKYYDGRQPEEDVDPMLLNFAKKHLKFLNKEQQALDKGEENIEDEA